MGQQSEDPAELSDSVSSTSDDQLWLIPREYEIGGIRWFSDAVGELQRAKHPLLAQIPRAELADMPRPPSRGEPMPPQVSPLFRPTVTQHEWTVHLEDVVEFNVDQLLADIDEMAENTGSQLVKAFIEHVSDVSELSGNVINSNGRDFFDVLADSLESMDIPFDANDEHNLTLLLNPNTLDGIKSRPPSPEQEARIDAVLNRKKGEWHASRRRRELP